MQKHVQTFLHKHYVHTLCVLGLDLGTLPSGKKVCCCFLMSKACHGRWPAVVGSSVGQQRSLPPPPVFPKFILEFEEFSLEFERWTCFLCDPAQLISLELSALMSLLGNCRWSSDPRMLFAFPGSLLQGMTSSPRHEAPEVCCSARVRDVTPCAPMWEASPMLLLLDQIFDSRRPLVAPIEARSLGSLAL